MNINQEIKVNKKPKNLKQNKNAIPPEEYERELQSSIQSCYFENEFKY